MVSRLVYMHVCCCCYDRGVVDIVMYELFMSHRNEDKMEALT